MASAEKFWNRMANFYSRQPIADEETYQKKLAKTREYFTPQMNLLEIGCGTGGTAVIHAPYVSHIHATDLSARMIDIAKERAADAKIDNITYECASIEEIEQPARDYDMVLALSVLHLLPERGAALKKIFNMVKPGGVFVSSTVCLSEFPSVFKIIMPLGRVIGLMPVLRFFSKDDLIEEIKDAGFEIDHVFDPGKKKAVFVIAKRPSLVIA